MVHVEMERNGAPQDGESLPKPVPISPIFQYENDDRLAKEEKSVGRYQTIQRLVTSAPNAAIGDVLSSSLGEVETCLEEFLAPNGDCLWRRISVRGGPGCGHGSGRFLHASFILPNSVGQRTASLDENQEQNGVPPGESIFCWASFPDRPKRKLLCVLSNPSLLCIWDVYPTDDNIADSEGGSGDEGHSVTLPFEACAIYPLGENHGLIFQRTDTIDDHHHYESIRGPSWLGETAEGEEGFVLTEPPKPLRLGMMLSPTAAGDSLDAAAPTPSSQLPYSVATVPSLFSLRHPLDEVLPVATVNSDSEAPTFMADVYEKLIFVGTHHWTDCGADVYQRQEHLQPICVTYHTRLKRHAVWTLKSAPPPPPTPPLWKVSRNQRIAVSASRSGNGLGVIEHASHIVDEGDLEMIAVTDSEIPHGDGKVPWISQQEALADALGVRTAKKADEMMPNRGRAGGNRSRRSGNLPGPATSFLSPPPVGTESRPFQPDVGKESSVTDDFAKDMKGTPTNFAGLTLDATNSISPFTNLHPSVALSLLYEEDPTTDGSHAQAANAFLVSNIEGSGTLVLCLLCPVQDKVNPFLLRCFSLNVERIEDSECRNKVSQTAIESPRHSFSLFPLTSIPCKSAQPIQAIPLAPCFRPRNESTARFIIREPLATDILILSNKESELDVASMSLYRSGLPIVDCALPAGCEEGDSTKPLTISYGFARVVGIAHAAINRMDFFCENEIGEEFIVRGELSLVMSSSSVAETTLGAIESGLISAVQPLSKSDTSSFPVEIEVALKIRADCNIMHQDLCGKSDLEDIAWSSVSNVVSSILDDLFEYGHQEISDVYSATKPFGRDRCDDDDAAWLQLLNSEFHQSYVSEHDALLFLGLEENGDNFMPKVVTPSQRSSMFSSLECMRCRKSDSTFIAPCIFDSLHLLYEDSKLSRTSRSSSWLQAIGSILVRTCARIDRMLADGKTGDRSVMCDFLNHYRRDLGGNFMDRAVSSIDAPPSSKSLSREPEYYRSLITSFSGPPCFFSWVDGTMKGFSQNSNGNVFFTDGPTKFNAACTATISLHRIFSILFLADEVLSGRRRDRAIIVAMIECGMTDPSELRDELPCGIALPLLETLQRCRVDQNVASSSAWSAAAWSLIGRADLSQHFGGVQSLSPITTDEMSLPIPRNIENYGLGTIDDDKDGIVALEVEASMRFPDDNRVHEAGRLLRSSRPSYLRVARAVEISDHDFERLKQEKLLVLCRRVLSLPLGRGMLTLGTLQPVPAEPLPIPELCLSGRVPPTNATLALDVTSCPSDMKVWPDFHNGVAAGLRLPDARDSKMAITRTWIVYNKPKPCDTEAAPSNGNAANQDASESAAPTDHAHGGLLMALGLRGHLSALSMTDIYDYLTEGTVTTTVGILLGMAANKRGTCDPSISKMLCLHVPSLLPPSFAAIDVASVAQAAAVAGVGLLYQKSSHRLMTEFLLNEMAKRPVNETSPCDREAYTLSCGLALGMVNLGIGTHNDGNWKEGGGGAGLDDLHIEERLYRYIVGGVDDLEFRRRREITDRTGNSSGVDVERCSRIFEGGMINTGVTAPGAILALGLMYLQSGNKAIASSLALPDTHFLLEYVRPDLLLLRVIACSLILWDDVSPTSKWIEDQVPSVVRKSYSRMRAAVKKVSGVSDISAFVLSDTAVPSVEGDELEQPERNGHKSLREEVPPEEKEIDRQAIRQIYANVIAGACFGIGLRFAGTGDKDASSALKERVKMFLRLRDDPIAFALKPEPAILEMCLGCSAVALAMIMAGTGDLETLKLFKMLRWRCDEDIKYGSHMAYGSAIGLLFLGGGNCTLGRAPEDVAALVMAFFPRFPSTSSDNQYHLQALRHCHALAVKRRGLHAMDVDTREEVFVPVEILVKETAATPICMATPCLLQNTIKTPMQLRVVSERYYPLSLNLLGHEFFESGQTLFVKKRSGFLSYFQDPKAQRSLLVQSGSSSWTSALELIQSFTEDPRILAYAQYLCDDGGTTFETRAQNGCRGISISDFCTEILHECLTSDKEEALPLYLSLRSAVESLETKSALAARTVWDVRLIRTYYEERNRFVKGCPDSLRLLNPEFTAVLTEMVASSFHGELDEKALLSYTDTHRNVGPVKGSNDFLGCFLIWYNIPLPH